MTFPPEQAAAYPEKSQATTVLVLGIIGILCCGPLGIVAWVMGQNELNAIDAGRRDPSQRGTANAGRIIGIIATVLWAAAILLGLLGVFALPFTEGFDGF